MKRITALILLLITLGFNVLFTVSCKSDTPPDDKEPSVNNGTPDDDGNTDDEKTIKIPEYKDYGRGTVNFTEMSYERPDFDAASAEMSKVTALITANTLPYDEQLAAVIALEDGYNKLLGMAALAGIYAKRNAADAKWAEEELFVNTNYPSYIKTVESLYVAAANSTHSESFCIDYFGEELYEYKDGGIYTENLVLLMEKEAELEAQYNSLSTATVEIVYEGIRDSVDNILAYYSDLYGESSKDYLKVKTSCDMLYEAECTDISKNLLVELLKQRRLIADELGYESYERFAYETIYHDYSPEQIDAFLDDVTEYVLPVYVYLSNYVFSPYIYEYEKADYGFKTDRVELINTLYTSFSESDAELGEIYSYMLQHSLYDIEYAAENRYEGAFSTYIDHYSAPFLFATLTGSALDYLTVAHEFGHFADSYINDNVNASLDMLEVSSQGAELLALCALKGSFDTKSYKYASYLELQNIFEVLIFQSFYASFEASVYELAYDAITLDAIDKTVAETAKKFGLSASVNSADYILIPHILLYPFYVQSYSTSAAVAAEIYCLEAANKGDGFKIYTKLIDRSEEATSFEEQIISAGLTSPFKENALRDIADKIYFSVMGAHYYTSTNNNVA